MIIHESAGEDSDLIREDIPEEISSQSKGGESGDEIKESMHFDESHASSKKHPLKKGLEPEKRGSKLSKAMQESLKRPSQPQGVSQILDGLKKEKEIIIEKIGVSPRGDNRRRKESSSMDYEEIEEELSNESDNTKNARD